MVRWNVSPLMARERHFVEVVIKIIHPMTIVSDD